MSRYLTPLSNEDLEDWWLRVPGARRFINAIASEAELNKAIVARFLLESDKNAKAIDAIVHPAVFSDFKQSGMKWIESAILYESGISKLVDRVVVVTAPDEIRIRRVMNRDGITREKVLQWMQRQWPQKQLIALSDYEIINDGITNIDAQLDLLLNKFDLALHLPT